MKEVSIMKLFRSINRYFRDAVKGVVRNFSLSVASISCITIILIVVALCVTEPAIIPLVLWQAVLRF